MTKEEYCRRFVDFMTREAGFDTFTDGRSVRSYAEEVAADYWCNCPDNAPEDAADADMDCWED